MERKIGEVFELYGVKLRVEKEALSECCDKCYFDFWFCLEYVKHRGLCFSGCRTDKTDVIFTEVKE